MEYSDVVQWEQRISYKTHSNTSAADAAIVYLCARVCGLINAAPLTSLPVAATRERDETNTTAGRIRRLDTLCPTCKTFTNTQKIKTKFPAAYCYLSLIHRCRGY